MDLLKEIEATIYDFNLNKMPPKRTAKRILFLVEKGANERQTSEADVRLNNLLGCKDLAEGMRGNKNKLVFFDDLHRVMELEIVKYGGEDDVLLIYLKKVK